MESSSYILQINSKTKNMTTTQSKLLIQIQKQTKCLQKAVVHDDRIEDLYQILTKIQSKNLMFIQLIVFLIEKGFVKNEHKLHYYLDLYDSIKGTASDQVNMGHKSKQDDEERFSKKKFVKVFKEMAKKIYPCDPSAFQNHIYKIIMGTETLGQIRMKIDDSVKKILTKDSINVFRAYEKQCQMIFEMYMPENFNSKLGFSWHEIKYLQKKLPIISVFRFLWDCEICPHYISPSHFFELTSKLVPPHSLLIGSGQKQGQFYSPESVINYAKQCSNQKNIKLAEGDIGVNYFEFQILLARLSVDITKQKGDFAKGFQCLMNLIKIKEAFQCKGEVKMKPNKFEQAAKKFFEQVKKSTKNNFQVQKTQTKKKIQQIMQNTEETQEESRNQFRDAKIGQVELLSIKKSLDDDHLPLVPEKHKIEKQNDSQYSIQSKNVVIGQQLPKLPEKNKAVGAPKKAEKKDDFNRKFKFEEPSFPKLSIDYYNQIGKVEKKQRVNQEFPVILIDAVYPSNIPNLYLNAKSQIYLETTYIHLGERSYEKAFVNYVKARTLCENTKNQTAQFFFLVLQAQIYEAAARDAMALLNFHKAKELAHNMVNKDVMLKYIAYKGLATCLYHLQEYEYSLRCFLKARQLRVGEMDLESVENAVLENNIGCIYMIMNRNNQAMKHLALSQRIMDLKLGKFHERAVVVQQNQKKNKKAFIEMAPQFKTMWRAYVEKPGIKSTSKAPKKK